MTFNEFINSPGDMDENSQEYKDFSQCVSSGAYVAFSVMEELFETTPSFDFSSAEEIPVFKIYKDALNSLILEDTDGKKELEKEFLDKLAEFASQTSLIVMNRLRDAMRESESYKIAVQTIEGDVLDIENDSSDESE